MSSFGAGAASVGSGASQIKAVPTVLPIRATGRLRIAAIDRDPGLTQVLVRRLDALGYESRVLSAPVSLHALVTMRVNALIVDPSVVDARAWDYLAGVCDGLPGLAVVVCTGPSSVAERVRALRMGIDAWVTKPCHPEELICVVEAAVRRQRRQQLPAAVGAVTVGEITIRSERHQAYVGERSLELTAREFEILQLLSQSDRVLRREEIYGRIWGYAMAHGDRSVDVFVRKLRRKLTVNSPGWRYIHTHFGVGYRFDPVPVGADDPVAEPPPQNQPARQNKTSPGSTPSPEPVSQVLHKSVTAG